jgi:hypothetical protein
VKQNEELTGKKKENIQPKKEALAPLAPIKKEPLAPLGSVKSKFEAPSFKSGNSLPVAVDDEEPL